MPVNITFNVPNNPQAGQTVPVTVTVTPQQNVDGELNCILPAGVTAVQEPGVRVMPYHQQPGWGTSADHSMARQYMVNFWAGSIPANGAKQFVFHITFANKGSYTFLCSFNAFTVGGGQAQYFTVNVN